MQKHIPLVIPMAVRLENAGGWTRLDEAGRQYCVVRFHCVLTRPHLDAGPYYGQPEDGFGAPADLAGESSVTRRVKYRRSMTEKSLTDSLVANETIAAVATKVTQRLSAASLVDVAGELKGEISNQLRTELRNTFAITELHEYEWEEERKLTIRLLAGADQAAFAVKAYSRCEYELWLGFIDYLFVLYRGFLIKRRWKDPPVIASRHNNFIAIKEPLMTIRYWEPIGESLWVVPTDYECMVLDPAEISFAPLTNSNPPYLHMAGPTLYKLSEGAFPKRWRDLKGVLTDE